MKQGSPSFLGQFLRRCIVTLSLGGALCLTGCGIRLPIKHQPVSVTFRAGDPAPSPPAKAPLVPVWVLSDRYHTGMVFPYEWLLECGLNPPSGFPGDTKYVCMSWGNQDAYSAAGLDSPWKWFRVLFTPTPSVMEMIPCNWHVTEVLPGQQIWLKMVERERGTGLAHFLNECARPGPDGTPEIVTRSSWGKGVQLGCSPSYFIPRVCNVWTVQAIESMGYPVNVWNSITASSLIRQIEAPPLHFAKIWPGGGKPESPIDPESAAGSAQTTAAR